MFCFPLSYFKTFLKFHFWDFILSSTSQVKTQTKPGFLKFYFHRKPCSFSPSLPFPLCLKSTHGDILIWTALNGWLHSLIQYLKSIFKKLGPLRVNKTKHVLLRHSVRVVTTMCVCTRTAYYKVIWNEETEDTY